MSFCLTLSFSHSNLSDYHYISHPNLTTLCSTFLSWTCSCRFWALPTSASRCSGIRSLPSASPAQSDPPYFSIFFSSPLPSLPASCPPRFPPLFGQQSLHSTHDHSGNRIVMRRSFSSQAYHIPCTHVLIALLAKSVWLSSPPARPLPPLGSKGSSVPLSLRIPRPNTADAAAVP